MNTTTVNKNFVFVLLSFLIFTSCEDVVDVTVPDGGDRLVVEASILWEKGTSGKTQTLRLSTSSAYFEENINTPVIGATVAITKDDEDTRIVFEDQNNGDYITDAFIPELNQSYTLHIEYNGQSFEAQETLISVVPIEGFRQSTDGGFGGDEIAVNVLFDDPPNVNNFYMGLFQSSVSPLVGLETLNDQFTDGNLNFIEYDNESFEAGIEVNVQLQGISKRYFNYLNLLIEQSDADGGPFQTTPVKVKGNCKNITTPNEEVLGYFRLSEVVNGQHVIE